MRNGAGLVQAGRIQAGRIQVDWGHLAFLAFITGLIVWYILDARSVSLSFNNLLFIQPTALVALVLVATIIPQCFRRDGGGRKAPDEAAPSQAPAADDERSETARVVAITAALGVYAVAINFIGFDIGTWLFAVASMFICGERRPLYIIVYPVLLSIAVISAFKALIPFPMFTVIL